MTTLRADASVHGQLEQAASEDGQRTWLRFIRGPSYTFGDLWTAVKGVGARLQELGVGKGDRVAYMLGNAPEFVESWLASHAVGAVSVPLNTALRGDVLRHLLNLATPKVLIAEADLLPRVHEAIGNADHLEIVVVREEYGEAARLFEGKRILRYDQLRRPGEPTPVELHPSDPCCIMYTSGTTGPSKGVTFTHPFTLCMAKTTCTGMGYGPDDTLYTCLPLFHSNALHVSFVPALVARAGIVIGERFSVSRFWSDIAESGATATNLLGAMSPLLLRQPPSDKERQHRLRTALVIPAPPDYYDLFPERFNVQPVEAYGLTDFGMLLWSPTDQRPRRGSCGLPTEGFEVKLVDDADEEVPKGEVGELVARPKRPWISSPGYWRMPEATLSAWRNMWFHTGDLMKQDPDGWFYFVDRTKDAIRRRGENVSSFEVEQAFLQHEGVQECAAYAIPSEFSEDEVAIAVVLKEGIELSPRELVEFAEPKLPYYALPRFVRLMGELPKTQTEKIQKHVLRGDGVTSEVWDRDKAGYKVAR